MRRGPGEGAAGLGVVASVVLAFLLLPMAIIAALSFSDSAYTTFPPPALSLRWYVAIAQSANWRSSFLVSVAIASATTILALALGLGGALALTRGHFGLKKLIYTVMLAPLILPGIVTALALYFFFAPLRMVGSPLAIILGHTVLALPIALIILCATIQGVDERLEQAASSLGASRAVILRRVTLPLIMPGLLSAAVFSFLSSFDEFFIALFLSTPTFQTLPIRIWSTLQYQIEPSVTAISTVLIGMTVGALVIVQLLRAASARISTSWTAAE
jgi:putative spermidine/putrescine transport system permease protein